MERPDREAIRKGAAETHRLAAVTRANSSDILRQTQRTLEAVRNAREQSKGRQVERAAERTQDFDAAELSRFVSMRDAAAHIEAEEERLRGALDRLRRERTMLLIESDSLARRAKGKSGLA